MPLLRIEEAIEHIKEGRMVILVDDEDRENEGDLCMAAEMISPDAINFMATYGRGLICLSMTNKRADALDLPLMVDNTHRPSGPVLRYLLRPAAVLRLVFPLQIAQQQF